MCGTAPVFISIPEESDPQIGQIVEASHALPLQSSPLLAVIPTESLRETYLSIFICKDIPAPKTEYSPVRKCPSLLSGFPERFSGFRGWSA